MNSFPLLFPHGRFSSLWWSNKCFLSCNLFLLRLFSMSLLSSSLFNGVFFSWFEKVFARRHLLIELTRLLRWREGSVFLDWFVILLCRLFRCLQVPFLEFCNQPISPQSRPTWQEPVPRLVDQLWVLGQFSPYHEFLDSVYRVNIVHTIHDNPSNFFETLERPHGRNSIPLDQHITFGQQLDGFESASVGTDDPLSSFDESLLVSNHASNLDHVTSDVVLENFQRLQSAQSGRCDPPVAQRHLLLAAATDPVP